MDCVDVSRPLGLGKGEVEKEEGLECGVEWNPKQLVSTFTGNWYGNKP